MAKRRKAQKRQSNHFYCYDGEVVGLEQLFKWNAIEAIARVRDRRNVLHFYLFERYDNRYHNHTKWELTDPEEIRYAIQMCEKKHLAKYTSL